MMCLEVNGLPAIQTPLPLSDYLLLSSIEIEITKNIIFYFTKSQKICQQRVKKTSTFGIARQPNKVNCQVKCAMLGRRSKGKRKVENGREQREDAVDVEKFWAKPFRDKITQVFIDECSFFYYLFEPWILSDVACYLTIQGNKGHNKV